MQRERLLIVIAEPLAELYRYSKHVPGLSEYLRNLDKAMQEITGNRQYSQISAVFPALSGIEKRAAEVAVASMADHGVSEIAAEDVEAAAAEKDRLTKCLEQSIAYVRLASGRWWPADSTGEVPALQEDLVKPTQNLIKECLPSCDEMEALGQPVWAEEADGCETGGLGEKLMAGIYGLLEEGKKSIDRLRPRISSPSLLGKAQPEFSPSRDSFTSPNPQSRKRQRSETPNNQRNPLRTPSPPVPRSAVNLAGSLRQRLAEDAAIAIEDLLNTAPTDCLLDVIWLAAPASSGLSVEVDDVTVVRFYAAMRAIGLRFPGSQCTIVLPERREGSKNSMESNVNNSLWEGWCAALPATSLSCEDLQKYEESIAVEGRQKMCWRGDLLVGERRVPNIELWEEQAHESSVSTLPLSSILSAIQLLKKQELLQLPHLFADTPPIRLTHCKRSGLHNPTPGAQFLNNLREEDALVVAVSTERDESTHSNVGTAGSAVSNAPYYCIRAGDEPLLVSIAKMKLEATAKPLSSSSNVSEQHGLLVLFNEAGSWWARWLRQSGDISDVAASALLGSLSKVERREEGNDQLLAASQALVSLPKFTRAEIAAGVVPQQEEASPPPKRSKRVASPPDDPRTTAMDAQWNICEGLYFSQPVNKKGKRVAKRAADPNAIELVRLMQEASTTNNAPIAPSSLTVANTAGIAEPLASLAIATHVSAAAYTFGGCRHTTTDDSAPLCACCGASTSLLLPEKALLLREEADKGVLPTGPRSEKTSSVGKALHEANLMAQRPRHEQETARLRQNYHRPRPTGGKSRSIDSRGSTKTQAYGKPLPSQTGSKRGALLVGITETAAGVKSESNRRSKSLLGQNVSKVIDEHKKDVKKEGEPDLMSVEERLERDARAFFAHKLNVSPTNPLVTEKLRA